MRLALGRGVAQFARGGVRQRDHLVREMDGVFRLLRMSEGPQRLAEQRLQIHLPRVDHVVDAGGAAERRGIRLAIGGRRRPQDVAIGLRRETVIAKVATEQAELPELVRNVFADVGDDAVGADDHFFARFLICLAGSPAASPLFDSHHPAAGQPAFGLQKHRALRFQDVERVRPEFQPEDVALVREQVVSDVQTRHRLQMRPHDPVDDQRAHVGGVIAAVLEIVKRPRANLESALIALVPFGDL